MAAGAQGSAGEQQHGKLISQDEYEANHSKWLLRPEDNDYLHSIMKPVYEPGKFANWIAAPSSLLRKSARRLGKHFSLLGRSRNAAVPGVLQVLATPPGAKRASETSCRLSQQAASKGVEGKPLDFDYVKLHD